MLTRPKRPCVQGSFVQVIRIPTMDRQKLVGGDGRMLLRVMGLRLAVQDFARDSLPRKSSFLRARSGTESHHILASIDQLWLIKRQVSKLTFSCRQSCHVSLVGLNVLACRIVT